MNSEVKNPPVLLEARAYSLSDIVFPAPVIIIEDNDTTPEILEVFTRLSLRIHSLLTKAKAENRGRRVSELRFLEHNMRMLEKVTKLACQNDSAMQEESSKIFQRLYKRIKLEISQFTVDGNVMRAVEMDYVLEDLQLLKAKSEKYGIML